MPVQMIQKHSNDIGQRTDDTFVTRCKDDASLAQYIESIVRGIARGGGLRDSARGIVRGSASGCGRHFSFIHM
jgi:hypothetical protein